jgi:hypothetical protein
MWILLKIPIDARKPDGYLHVLIRDLNTADVQNETPRWASWLEMFAEANVEKRFGPVLKETK